MDAVEDHRDVHRVVVEAREIVGFGGVAVPTVFRPVAVFDFAFVGGICGGLEEVFDQIDSVVEHVVVGAAYVDAEFAAEFGAEGGPVALEDVAEVVVFLPVGGDFRIDVAGFLVEDLHGITVGADWAVDGLPDVELFAGARVIAESELVLVGALCCGDGVAEIVAIVGLSDLRVQAPGMKEGVLIFVEVYVGVGAEVDGIGAGDEGAVVMIGIKHFARRWIPIHQCCRRKRSAPSLDRWRGIVFRARG